jgi:hypothetical protein
MSQQSPCEKLRCIHNYTLPNCLHRDKPECAINREAKIPHYKVTLYTPQEQQRILHQAEQRHKQRLRWRQRHRAQKHKTIPAPIATADTNGGYQQDKYRLYAPHENILKIDLARHTEER